LIEIEKTEKAEEGLANSLTTWFLSPLSLKSVLSKQEKDEKNADRLQRLHSKHIKETALRERTAELCAQEKGLECQRQSFDMLNQADQGRIKGIELRILRREQERQEKRREEIRQQRRKEEQEEMARCEKVWREREAAMAAERLKKAEEERAKRQKEYEAQTQSSKASRKTTTTHRTSFGHDKPWNTGSSSGGSCNHGGWWTKVPGRASCGKCYESFGYLLESPGCKVRRYASCQAVMRSLRGCGPKVRKSYSGYYDD
jgi:hypothetical protein